MNVSCATEMGLGDWRELALLNGRTVIKNFSAQRSQPRASPKLFLNHVLMLQLDNFV
jgi:hypothetical protein